MNLLVIDGQGGSLGQQLVAQLKAAAPQQPIIAVGTNSRATAAMLRAGADAGATGENPVTVNSASADLILGPIGIVLANSMLGEITPKMACAVGASPAKKILIPLKRCNCCITGGAELPLSRHIAAAVGQALEFLRAGASPAQ